MATHVWQDTNYKSTARETSTVMDLSLLVIGRLIFGGYFLFSGLHHFLDRAALTGAAASEGVPFPELAILATGTMLVVGGIGIMTGVWPRLGALLVVLFLVGVTPVMHAFWKDPDGPQRMNN